ncbi:MAG: hypothetical protein ACK40X_06865 [Armatimonadota bacterium]
MTNGFWVGIDKISFASLSRWQTDGARSFVRTIWHNLDDKPRKGRGGNVPAPFNLIEAVINFRQHWGSSLTVVKQPSPAKGRRYHRFEAVINSR